MIHRFHTKEAGGISSHVILGKLPRTVEETYSRLEEIIRILQMGRGRTRILKERDDWAINT